MSQNIPEKIQVCDNFIALKLPQDELLGEDSDGYCLELCIEFIKSYKENCSLSIVFNRLIIACQKMQPKPDGFDDESDILEREFNDEPPFIDIKLDMGSIYKFIKSFQSNLCGILVINHGEKDSHAIAMVGIPNTENAFSYMYDPNIGVIFAPPRGIGLAFHCIQSMYTVNSMIFYDLS